MCSGNMTRVGTPAAFDDRVNDRLNALKHEQLSTSVGIFNVGWDILNGFRSLSDRMRVPRLTSCDGQDKDDPFPHKER